MKNLIPLSLLIFSFSLFATDKIDENVMKICKLAKSCEVYETKSSKIKSMIEEYSKIVNEEPLISDDYVNSISELPDIDDTIWGRMTLGQALSFVSSHGPEDEEDTEAISKKDLYQINGYILKMLGTGVEFGFSANTGGVVCGVVFPGLLIMNKKTKMVYDIALFGQRQC